MWKELKPIKESTVDFEKIEARIIAAFRKKLYEPLMKELLISRNKIENSTDDLLKAITEGTITFSKATFSGKFDAKTSRELRELGATWDKKTSSFKLTKRSLPIPIRSAINTSAQRFEERLKLIDKKISEVLPEEIAGSVKTADLFDHTLWKTEKEFQKTLENITVAPQLSNKQRVRIAEEWQDNMDLFIKDFAEEEIKKLRQEVMQSAFAGNRRESLIDSIQKSYGVTQRKARFLARQETSLMMAKFKEVRYTDVGVKEYRWACVAGSKNHPVRHSHKILEGKVFRWDTPPITTAPNEPVRRNNPGQDYNCRCFARPIVKF